MPKAEELGFQTFLKARGCTWRERESDRPKFRAKRRIPLKEIQEGNVSQPIHVWPRLLGTECHYQLTDARCLE